MPNQMENQETIENSRKSMALYFILLLMICCCFYIYYCLFLSRDLFEKITPKKKNRTDDILRCAERKSDFLTKNLNR